MDATGNRGGTKSAGLAELLGLLDLEQVSADIYRGQNPTGWTRPVYGGQVAAQALAAAGRTVPAGQSVHSLHAYFVSPGEAAAPILYRVDRVSDRRSFTLRRVSATQRDREIFTLSASFHRAENGLVHSDPMPEVPAPESLPTYEE